MTGERFNELLDRYKHGRLSEQEWEELMAAAAEDTFDAHIREDIMLLLESRRQHITWTPAVQDEVWQKINLARQPAAETAPTARKRWWPYAAAVLLLLAAGGAAYLLQRPAQPVQIVQQPIKPDAQPGGNKAILTLQDGTEITLDSASNGLLAQQGNAKVSKLANGRLAYLQIEDKPAETIYNTMRTPRGGQYQLDLPDGTTVWLNSASSLKFPAAFAGAQRTVELTGQAYFEVAPHKAWPFTVKVGDMEVEVLGTHFDIMAYPDEKSINTTLLEGKVKVLNKSGAALLQPGEQAVLQRGSGTLSVMPAQVSKVTAWKQGLFVFNKMDIESIMREVSRWYDVDVVYPVPFHTAGKLYGGGISRSMLLSDVLHFLEESGIHHFKIEGKKVIVLP
ncbi:FecR domain-containing protein [Chitinophaga sp.]|uniref:FecR family protein n=1 Tax=Chitinophaga sp. TaxID=1869181 RepID=UPI0031E2606E